VDKIVDKQGTGYSRGYPTRKRKRKRKRYRKSKRIRRIKRIRKRR